MILQIQYLVIRFPCLAFQLIFTHTHKTKNKKQSLSDAHVVTNGFVGILFDTYLQWKKNNNDYVYEWRDKYKKGTFGNIYQLIFLTHGLI